MQQTITHQFPSGLVWELQLSVSVQHMGGWICAGSSYAEQSGCAGQTFFIESTKVLSQLAALQPYNWSPLHREVNAEEYVQSDWCNQGQNGHNGSHAQRFAAPEIWNNIDGATEQRETGTTGQLEWGSFFLLGDERGSWISYRATEVLVLSGVTRSTRSMNTKVHTDDSLWLLHV